MVVREREIEKSYGGWWSFLWLGWVKIKVGGLRFGRSRLRSRQVEESED